MTNSYFETKQPEALRLAEKSEKGHWIGSTDAWREEAAAELRRLHEVNVKLLEALKSLIDMDVSYQRGEKVVQAVEAAKAVIAKAEVQE